MTVSFDVIDPIYFAEVSERLAAVQSRIAKAGGDRDVKVVAVTKTFDLSACRCALALGIFDLGENFANELVAKASALSAIELRNVEGGGAGDLGEKVNWHFLGGIQRNKLARLAPYVGTYEGVDRLEEAAAIARHAPGAAVYVEVLTDDQGAKAGVVPDEVERFVDGLGACNIEVRGLMTVAPQGDLDRARSAFRTVRSLVDRLGLKEASMGMSDDLEVAVQEGATQIRVGRALFGPRQAL